MWCVGILNSDEVKIQRSKERIETLNLVKDILLNPVALAIVGYYLSDRLQGDYVEADTGLVFEKEVWDSEKQEYVPAVRLTEKKWDPNAGKLNAGAAIAMQAGMTAYLGSEALKSIAGSVSLIK
jgi:hypothetical protein